MRTIKKKKSKRPNRTTIKALKELDEMERNKEKYPRYDSVNEILKTQIKKPELITPVLNCFINFFRGR